MTHVDIVRAQCEVGFRQYFTNIYTHICMRRGVACVAQPGLLCVRQRHCHKVGIYAAGSRVALISQLLCRTAVYVRS